MNIGYFRTEHRATVATGPGGLFALMHAAGAGRTAASTAGVSPEELILNAQAELSQIDSELSNLLGNLQDQSRKGHYLRAVSQRVQEWAAAHGEKKDAKLDLRSEQIFVQDPATGARRSISLADALKEAGFDPDRQTDYRRDQIDQLRGALQQHAQGLSEGSETRSLRLQQLVSRRGQVTQLASQLLQAMHETAKQVVANIR